MDGYNVTVVRELPHLQEVHECFDKNFIFNADETDLNYTMYPDRAISTAPVPDHKKNNRR